MATTVLFIERGGEVGGAERVLLDIVRHADRSRHRPLVACLADGSLPSHLRAAGAPTTVLPVARLRDVHHVVRALIGLVRLVRREQVDIVHVNGTMMLAYGGPVAWLTRRRLVWQVYDPQGTRGLARRVFVAAVSRFRPDWTVFSTLAVEENHRRVFPRIGRSSVILPGVDQADFEAAAPDRSVLPAGVDRDAVVLLALARHIPGKGLEDLVAGMARLGSGSVHLVLCGGLPTPGYTGTLERLVAELGVASTVHLVGYVTEPVKRVLLATSDVVVHPALVEPFGITVLEAMAAGRPVVAADAAGPRHLVVHGVTGLVYPRGDVDALVAALTELAGDPGRRRAMGAAGRRRAGEFSVQRMVDAVGQVWDDVLAPARV